MTPLWEGLLANFAIPAVIVMIWSLILDHIGGLPARMRAIALGIIFGAGAMAAMAMAFELTPGLIFDFRAPLLAAAGFFGGWPAALIATVAALAYRLDIGGAGVWAGCLSILIASAIGLAGFWSRKSKPPRHVDLVVLAAAVAGTGLVGSFVLPHAVWSTTLPQLSLPVILLTFVATLLLGVSLAHEDRRRELIRSNFIHRALVEALPDCLNIKDIDGKFVIANSATARLMRAETAADLTGKTDFDFYPEAVARRFRDDEIAFLEKGEFCTIDQEAKFPDGSARWLSTLKAPLRNGKGELFGIITHNRDITERKNLQLKLETTQQQLDDALENMTDGLVLYDSAGRMVFCNRRYDELFPVTASLHVPGTPLVEIIRQAALRGEETVPPGMDLESWARERAAMQLIPGEHLIELSDGRCLEARTRPAGNDSTLIVISDITERRNFERELEHKALHDPLTGLPNRAMFNMQIGQAYAQARSSKTELAIMLLDLDRFKNVNDTFGHAAGDKLLIEVAARLQSVMRQGDLVARLGGDEFAILASGSGMAAGAAGLAHRIIKKMSGPLPLGDVDLIPGVSIGYTVWPQDAGDPETLLVNADRALYAAKAMGRGRSRAYSPDLALSGALSRAG